jgi:membrane protein
MARRTARGGGEKRRGRFEATREAAAHVSRAAAGASRRAPACAQDAPSRLSARAWRHIAVGVWEAFNRDNISIIAAGVSFNIVLAIFPPLAAFVSLYGLVADVNTAAQHVAALRMILPADFGKIVGEEMLRLARDRPEGLSLTLAVGVAISLWSANGAMRAMIVGLNVAYDTTEKRGFVRLTLVTLTLTLGLMTFLTAVVLASIGGLCILYRLGPSRPFGRRRWITWAAPWPPWSGSRPPRRSPSMCPGSPIWVGRTVRWRPR